MKINAPFDRSRINEALDVLNDAARDNKERLSQLIEEQYADLKNIFGARVAESAESLRERSRRVLDESRRQIRTKARDLDEHVRRNPWSYLGVAAPAALTAGLLVGYLMGRKRY